MGEKLSAKEAAVKIIAIKDRTERELLTKLTEKGYEPREIAEAMSFASEYGYINDREYAKKYINDSLNVRGHGFNRIKAELLRKGIERAAVEEEIELAKSDPQTDTREKMLGIMENRFANSDLSNPKERNRIFGYFARRGYSPGEIWGVINAQSAFKDIYSEELE